MPVIFTSLNTTKGQLYQNIKDILTGAGWQNISSEPASDYDVFYSTGESGNSSLYFQLYDNGHSTGTNAYFLAKLINLYTPGTPGNAGTFQRSNEQFRKVYTAVASTLCSDYSPDFPLTLDYNVNKDRLIAVISPQYPGAGYASTWFCIGQPKSLINEVQSRGVVLALSGYDANFVGYNDNCLRVTSASYYETTTSQIASIYLISPPRTVNTANKIFMSEIAYSDSNNGFRGIIDGIYAIASTQYLAPYNKLTDGQYVYKVVNAPGIPYNMAAGINFYAYCIGQVSQSTTNP